MMKNAQKSKGRSIARSRVTATSIPILASLSVFWYTNPVMEINKALRQMKNLDVAKLERAYKA